MRASASIERVDRATFVEQPWANGGGSTMQLAADTTHAPWHWRISIARLEGAAAFSRMPGVRRQFAPLDAAVELAFASSGQVRTMQRLQTLEFAGDDAPTCEVPGDAPLRACNLMLRRGAQGQLLARPLVGSMMLAMDAHVRWFVYLHAGHAELTCGSMHLALTPCDAAWVTPEHRAADITTRCSPRIEGAGEIILVRLTA